MDTIVIEGELSVVVAGARVVVALDTPAEADLADLIREATPGLSDQGIVHLGPVRIVIEPLVEGS